MKRVLAPWSAIERARNVLVARKKRRVSGAARDLTALDAAIVAFVEVARIQKQLTGARARHAKGHLRHGQQLAVQFLLEDYRAASQAVPALLRGAPTTKAPSLPACFASDIRTAAKHGTLTLTDTKNREPRVVFLNDQAAAVVRDAIAASPCEHVFVSRTKKPYTADGTSRIRQGSSRFTPSLMRWLTKTAGLPGSFALGRGTSSASTQMASSRTGTRRSRTVAIVSPLGLARDSGRGYAEPKRHAESDHRAGAAERQDAHRPRRTRG